jgi:hypothetical protein
MKRTNKLLIMVAIMMLPGFMFTTYAQKAIKLEYNLKKGDRYHSTMDMNQDIDMEVQGQTMTVSNKMGFEFSYMVSKVEADSFELKTTIDVVTMNQSVMGMDIVYDSRDSSTFNNAMVGTKISDEMNKLIGATITTTLSKNGNTGSVDLGALDKDNNIARNMKTSFSQAVYPDHKVKIGDSWNYDVNTSGITNMTMHMKYTLTKITRKQAFISVEGTIDSPDDSDSQLKGTLSGEMTVDRKTGWTTHSSFDQDFEMQMEQQGMSFPATISGSYEINSKKVN